jgi:hypothetical protein
MTKNRVNTEEWQLAVEEYVSQQRREQRGAHMHVL